MGEQILDGTGNGYLAKVDSDFNLHVRSRSESIQHIVSQNEEEAYQCIGLATLSSGTTTALHLKNTSTDKDLVVTYIRHQIIDHWNSL
jgi:hypothetical protein